MTGRKKSVPTGNPLGLIRDECCPIRRESGQNHGESGPIRRESGQNHGESGQMMVLIIGYVLLTLFLITAVAGVSTVYIEHKKLLSVADGAAVAAADSYTLGQVVGEAGAPGAALSQDRVAGAVATYLDKNNCRSQFSGLAVGSGTGTSDGRTAQVTLTAVVHPAFINFLVPDGIAVTATSTARSQLRR